MFNPWFAEIWERCYRKRALVIGDLMLDRETAGEATRICPEAPVPVARSFFCASDSSLGGAGNVARNLAGLGCEVVLGSVMGGAAASELVSLLADSGIDQRGLIHFPNWLTPVKHRFYAGGQMMMRHDTEVPNVLEEALEYCFIELLVDLIREFRPELLIISDYAKGTITEGVAAAVMSEAWRELFDECLVLVDSKQNPMWFRKADIVTPNVHELHRLHGVGFKEPLDEEAIVAIAASWRKVYDVDRVVVTRGAEGVLMVGPGFEVTKHAGKARQAYDVSGAGDTFVAALGASLAGFAVPERNALAFAVECAGKVCTEPGVTAMRPGWFELVPTKVQTAEGLARLAELWQENAESVAVINGCFDLLHEGHMRVVAEARRRAQKVVAFVNDDAMVMNLKGPDRPIRSLPERMALLSWIEGIDHVVPFSSEAELSNLIDLVEPLCIVRGADHKGEITLEPCPVFFVERAPVSSSSLARGEVA